MKLKILDKKSKTYMGKYDQRCLLTIQNPFHLSRVGPADEWKYTNREWYTLLAHASLYYFHTPHAVTEVVNLVFCS